MCRRRVAFCRVATYPRLSFILVEFTADVEKGLHVGEVVHRRYYPLQVTCKLVGICAACLDTHKAYPFTISLRSFGHVSKKY